MSIWDVRTSHNISHWMYKGPHCQVCCYVVGWPSQADTLITRTSMWCDAQQQDRWTDSRYTSIQRGASRILPSESIVLDCPMSIHPFITIRSTFDGGRNHTHNTRPTASAMHFPVNNLKNEFHVPFLWFCCRLLQLNLQFSPLIALLHLPLLLVAWCPVASWPFCWCWPIL